MWVGLLQGGMSGLGWFACEIVPRGAVYEPPVAKVHTGCCGILHSRVETSVPTLTWLSY